MTITVSAAGLLQERELCVGDLKELTPQLSREGCRALTVLGVMLVVLSTRIMQPSEELDDDGVGSCASRKLKANSPDASPV